MRLQPLLLFLGSWLVMHTAYAQTLLRQESFETNGEGTRYTSTTFDLRNEPVPLRAQYFLREDNPVQTANGTQTFGTPGAPTTIGNVTGAAPTVPATPVPGSYPNGSFFWASEGATGQNGVRDRLAQTVTLNPVTIAGYTSLKVQVAFADARGAGAPSGGANWENDDFVRVQVRVNGTGSWITIGQFVGDNPAGGFEAGNLRQDTNLDGVSSNEPSAQVVTATLTDFTFSYSGSGTTLEARVEVDENGGTEELAFDNIRVIGTFSGTTATVTTAAPGSITTSSATLGGNVTADGGATVTERGVVYSSSTNTPTTSNTKAINGSGTGTFSATVGSLTPSTTYYVRAYAINSVGTSYGSMAQSFVTLTPIPVVTVTPAPLAAGGVGLAYSSTFTASGGSGPYTYDLTAGTLPAGLSLSAGGVLAGTPTAGGTFTFTVRATDNNGIRGSQSFELTVAAPTVAVAPATLPGGTTGTAYSQPVSASGGTAPYTYAVTVGALPTGLTLSSGGSLSGTPTAGGTFNFTVTATDASTGSGPFTGSRAYSVTIVTATATVTAVTRLTPSPTATAQVNYRVVFSASVTGVSASNFSLTTTGALSGASVSSVTGSGTSYTVTVNTGTDDGTLRLDVANGTDISPSLSDTPYTAGEVYTITKSFGAAPSLSIVGTGGTGSDVTAFVDVVRVLSGGSAFANGLQNGSFETHNPYNNGGNTFAYNPTGANWTFNSRSGIADAGSAFSPTTPIPNGIAVAFVQSNGGSNGQLQQNLAVPTGSYQVSFQTAQRVCCTTLDQRLNAFINGVFVGTIQPGTSAYSTFTSATFSVTAPAPTASIASQTNVACNGGSNGNATITVSGGTAPYIYNWTPGNPTGNGTASISNLSAGTYTLTVTDANNSTTTTSVTITQPTLALSVTPASQTNVACFGGSNGAASINPATGGTASYTYNWTPGNPTGDGTTSIGGLSAGTYTVTVTDANNCTATHSFTIAQPAALTAMTSQTNVTTNGGSNGTASVSVGGGAGGYSYNWMPGNPTGDGTASVSGLMAGTYSVLVTDDNNCTILRSITITQPAPVTAAPTTTTPADGTTVSTNTPTYSGTAPAASTVTVYVDGTSIGTTTATAGGSWSLSQPTALSQGSHTVYATALSSGETLSANSNTNTFTVDTVRPTVAISSTTAANGDGSSNATFAYTVTFSEAVNGFVAGDVTVGNGTLSGFGGAGTTYTFNVTPAGDGAVTVNVPANVAQDPAGNTNTAATQYSITYAAPVTATTWTGAVSTDWYTPGNWTAGIPTVLLDATIPVLGNGRYPAIGAGTASTKNLTVNNGATIDQTGGTLDVRGNLANNGTLQPTDGTVVLGSTTPASVLGSGDTRFWNLTVGPNGAQLSTSASTSVRRLLTLDGDLTTNANPLTLESNTTSTAMVVNNSGTVLGTATVQRYINPSLNAGPGYRHYSSPVQATTVADLATNTFTPVVNPLYNTTGSAAKPFPTVFGYDEARLNATTATTRSFDQGWFSPTAATDVLNVGRGYTVNLSSNETVDLMGTLNTGTVPVGALSRGTEANAGWHLLGNPYPAPIDWSVARAGLPTGVQDAVYVYKSSTQYDGTYQFYQNGFGSLRAGLIGAMQGFFVRVSQDVPAFSFQNAWRLTAYHNPTFNRPTADTRPAVQLDLVNAAGTHEPTFVYFENGATAGFDVHYDADKLPNSTRLNLSSEIADGRRLAVNGLPELGSAPVTVPLAVGVPAAGSFSFSAAQLLNLSTTPVYLRDLQTGAVVDLRTQSSYGFTVSNASALITGRFELVFSPQRPLATAPAALAAQVGLYPNPARSSAFVELPAVLGRTAVTATLVDALGRTVRTQALPAQGAIAHRLSLAELATGVYTLQLHTSAGVLVKKLVVE